MEQWNNRTVKADLLRRIDFFLGDAQRPLIVLVGPTAAGKTSLSLEVAEHVHGEIINADSCQVYRFLDIGTAKITEADMRGIPHHLLSVKDPKEEITVGWYQETARNTIAAILARGTIPLLVGGSMLYVASITDGLSLAPPADPAIRKRLMQEYDHDGGVSLYRRLQSVDAEAASSIHPHNKPYVIRAVEIYETLKMPKSAVIEQKKCSCTTLMLGVKRLKSDLDDRIRERVEAMFAQGWLSEVRDLLTRGYRADDPGMKSTGYREIIQYLRELEAAGSDADPEAMQETLKKKIVTKTRQYAKRQLTWWRNDPRIHWISVA